MPGEMLNSSPSASSPSPEPGDPTLRKKFFDFNPPSLVRPRSEPVPVPSAPLHFLDHRTHLHDAGVSGIPSLLSFREALNTDLRVLMLSDAGRPLGQRMDSERKVTKGASILTAIHEAGVLHHDVHSWNIMEDQSGRVRFTDFDRSSSRGIPEDYLAEQETLDRFIEGEYVDKDDIIGEDDVRRPRAARAP
ncbi:hypothetical protein BDZ89DRAFT_1156707 [Hymenopellis radicata]|nr:hypothetical protein BDZ89DRAFT_1156707 [Hymenopellis radicata]